MQYLLAYIGVIVGVFGTLSPLCPAVAILSSDTLRNTALFQMLVNLALSESYFMLLGVINSITNIVGVAKTPMVCSGITSMVISAAISASFALFTLSVERYISVIHGLRYYDLLNDTNRRLLISSSWLFGAGYWLLHTLQMMEFNDWTNYQGECLFMSVIPPYLLCVTFATILLLSTVVLVMNAVVSRLAAKHSREINEQRRTMGLPEDENPMTSFWGILKVSVIILVLIVPVNVIMLVDLLITPVLLVVKQITMIMAYLVYCFDGWLFGYFNTQLLVRYRQIFYGEIPGRAIDIEMGFDGVLREYSGNEFIEAIEFEDEREAQEIVVEANRESSGSIHSLEAAGPACQHADELTDEYVKDAREHCSLHEAYLSDHNQSSANIVASTTEDQSTTEKIYQQQDSTEEGSQIVEITAVDHQTNQVKSTAELVVVYRRTDDGEYVRFMVPPDLLTAYSEITVEDHQKYSSKIAIPDVSDEQARDDSNANKQSAMSASGIKLDEARPDVISRIPVVGEIAEHDQHKGVGIEAEPTSEDDSIAKSTGNHIRSWQKNIDTQANLSERKAEIIEMTAWSDSFTEQLQLPKEQNRDSVEDNSCPHNDDDDEGFRLAKNEIPAAESSNCSAIKPATRNTNVSKRSHFQKGGVLNAATNTEYRLPCSYKSTDMPPVE